MIKINGTLEKSVVEPEELIKHIGEIVVIQGSIYKIRLMSGFAFVIHKQKQKCYKAR